LEPLEHPAAALSLKRRQQVVTEPQPNSPTGGSAQGVDVRHMNRIAAMQARSGTVRGAPPRAWEGGWQQRLDAPPGRVGQQSFAQGGHDRDDPTQPA
jgi:hypothetical protein